MLASDIAAHGVVANWIHREQNGDRVIIDPFTKAPLSGMAVPALIQYDSELYRGITAYRDLSVAVELALGVHVDGTDLNAKGDPGWFERAVRSPDLAAFAYEGVHSLPFCDARLRLDGHLLRTVFRFAPNDHTNRIARALAGAKAVSGPCEPAMFDAVKPIMRRLDRALVRSVAPKVDPEDPKAVEAHLDAFTVSQYLCETVMAAKAGLLVRRAALRRPPATLRSPLQLLVLLSAAHAFQEVRLTTLGARVTVRRLPLSEKDRNAFYSRFLPDVSQTGRISASYTAELLNR